MLKFSRVLICIMLVLALFTSCSSQAVEENDYFADEGEAEGGRTNHFTDKQEIEDSANYLVDERFDTDEYLEGFDAGYPYNCSGYIAETPDAFYILPIVDGNISFYDKASGITGPLCARPDCRHDSEDCNAYVTLPRCIGFYDGKLYWVGKVGRNVTDPNHYIYSCDLDGSDRRQVALYEEMPPGGQLNYNGQIALYHRGYCYTAYSRTFLEDGVYSERTYLYAISLETGEKITILDEQDIGTPLVSFTLQPVGNDIYISYLLNQPEEQDSYLPVKFQVFHSKTRKLEDLGIITPSGGELWNTLITEDGSIYLHTTGGHVEKGDLSTGKSEVFLSSEIGVYLTEEYIIELPRIEEDGTVTFRAWYFSGNLLEFEKTPRFDPQSGVTKKRSIDTEIIIYPAIVKENVYIGQTLSGYYVAFSLDGSDQKIIYAPEPEEAAPGN